MDMYNGSTHPGYAALALTLSSAVLKRGLRHYFSFSFLLTQYHQTNASPLSAEGEERG